MVLIAILYNSYFYKEAAGQGWSTHTQELMGFTKYFIAIL